MSQNLRGGSISSNSGSFPHTVLWPKEFWSHGRVSGSRGPLAKTETSIFIVISEAEGSSALEQSDAKLGKRSYLAFQVIMGRERVHTHEATGPFRVGAVGGGTAQLPSIDRCSHKEQLHLQPPWNPQHQPEPRQKYSRKTLEITGCWRS